MKDLEIDGQSLRLSVQLEDLVQANDLSSLRSGLVERAAAAATQGTKRSILRRIERLFKEKLPARVKDEYLRLVERRNSIVHENWRGDLSSQELEEAFDIGLEFVKALGRLVAARALPIHDPMHLYDDAPEKP
jgi:hypothetical protein